MMESSSSSSCSAAVSSSISYTHHNGTAVVYWIPDETCAPFGTYPNPLNLTDMDRAQFHPVVQYPNNHNNRPQQPQEKDENDLVGIVGKNYLGISILDHTKPSSKNKVELATQQQRDLAAQGQSLLVAVDNIGDDDENVTSVRAYWQDYGIGRYDENRPSMYTSDLFNDTNNDIDGFDGARTLHVGIDLDGPLYTPVHAFWHGTVHAIGCNADLGDYGHVIVVRHELPALNQLVVETEEDKSNINVKPNRTVFALYGHLADFGKVPTKLPTSSSTTSSTETTSATTTTITTARNVGDTIQRGDILGYLGNVHENGGWLIPHVHFQLALEAPATHDMPGAVAIQDRPRALVMYPDPRYILGPLH